MVKMGVKVRDLYAAGADRRVAELVDDRYLADLADLADAIAGRLGGRVGVAPRLHAKNLVSEVLTWQVPRLAGAAPSYQSKTLLRQRPTE